MTMQANAMSIANLLDQMHTTHGIPFDVGLDVLRMVMMFAIPKEGDIEKAANAVTPPEMKGEQN